MNMKCVCDQHKGDTKPWVCPVHGMFWSKPLVIKYRDGSEVKLAPNTKRNNTKQ